MNYSQGASIMYGTNISLLCVRFNENGPSKAYNGLPWVNGLLAVVLDGEED